MITNYLNALKNKGSFTYETISNLSGIPEATIKNIFSGKTEDPRFETVSAIVNAMGGSLDAIYSAAKRDDVEANAVIALKEAYEQRITDIRSSSEERILMLKEHIETIKLDKRWYRIATCITCFALVTILLIDVMFGHVGWIRY